MSSVEFKFLALLNVDLYSQSTRAGSILSTHSCFSSFEKQYQVLNGIDGLKVPLLGSVHYLREGGGGKT